MAPQSPSLSDLNRGTLKLLNTSLNCFSKTLSPLAMITGISQREAERAMIWVSIGIHAAKTK
jgi:hypothetical protein